MDVPYPIFTEKSPKEEIYKKTTENNENYSLNIKMKENDSIYISITFDGDNKIYEYIKSYEDIKKQKVYFENYNLYEIYSELTDLINKNNYELYKNHEQIMFNVVLPTKEKNTLDFILEIRKSDNIMNDTLFNIIIKQKDEIIKKQEDMLKQKDEMIKRQEELYDEMIKEKNNIINELREIIKKNNYDNENKEICMETKEEENQNNNIIKDYDEIFCDFNIAYHLPKNKIRTSAGILFNTILQLQDGRLASGINLGLINIYNKRTFIPDKKIQIHQDEIKDIIQLKNGNLLSCCSYDDKLDEFEIKENNYKLLSSIYFGQDEDTITRKILELENNEIGLVTNNYIFFYIKKDNDFNEDFKIKYNNNQIGKFYEMIFIKPGELVISGSKNKIQFLELKTKKLKEIIDINRNICFDRCNLLCMMNKRCLCVGGRDKITLIDVDYKHIISEINDNGFHRCLINLNNSILLTGKDNGDITQWKIDESSLTYMSKKEKADYCEIIKIILFNNLIISCSKESIKICVIII